MKPFSRIVLNSYCLYTTWTVIASLVNLNMAVIYVPTKMVQVLDVWVPEDAEQWFNLSKTGAYVCLSLLVVFHVTYFILENFVVEQLCR